MRVRSALLAMMLAAGIPGWRLAAQGRTGGSLLVFHVGSLRRPLETVSRAFEAQHPGMRLVLEGSGSLDAIRKLTDQRRVPDVLVVADFGILPRLVVPRHAGW